ncbi:HNH endonuclease signature motif containing protein [Streptomyces sp. NPDC001984]
MKTPIQRILERSVAGPNACIVWTGAKQPKGYGQIQIDGRRVSVHRIAYETFKGAIPEGLEIDHACHTRDRSCPGGPTCMHRRCVNPHHLEAVTHGENLRRSQGFAGVLARRTHCGHGHEFTPENTRWKVDGSRACRTCLREQNRARKARKRGNHA